jgi:hypothetical protein
MKTPRRKGAKTQGEQLTFALSGPGDLALNSGQKSEARNPKSETNPKSQIPNAPRTRAPKGRNSPAQGNALGPGQRPGNKATKPFAALKGRNAFRAGVSAGRPGIGLRPFRAQTVSGPDDPGRCPGLTNCAPLGLTNGCAFGATTRRPEGAGFISPGQRPGNKATKPFAALKGRNPFRAGVSAGRPGIGFCPFRAQTVSGPDDPGRCPGLTNCAPLGRGVGIWIGICSGFRILSQGAALG